MKLTKEQKNVIIEALSMYGQFYNEFEYGLPTFDGAQMAKMREVIDKALEEMEK